MDDGYDYKQAPDPERYRAASRSTYWFFFSCFIENLLRIEKWGSIHTEIQPRPTFNSGLCFSAPSLRAARGERLH